MFTLDPPVLIAANSQTKGMCMSISLFGYVLLAVVTLLAAYLAGVSKVEPPLEHYEAPAGEGSGPSVAEVSTGEG